MLKKLSPSFFKALGFICILLLVNQAKSRPPAAKEFYQIKIYQLKNNEQVARVDSFLKEAYLPAMHRAGINKLGVFKPLANDTAAVKIIYVFTPFKSWEQFYNLPSVLGKDETYKTAGKSYHEAAFNNPPYIRVESVLLDAFVGQLNYTVPKLTGPVSEKIYELRSYEGPTEKLYEGKVKMFNVGDEIGLFKRLNFNSVFYANVISGSHMPNLMYLTSFENMPEREAHWKAFFDDPQWKKINAMPEYQNTVSHADIILMHATDYSDL